MIVDEKTYESPFNRAKNAERWGADPFYQAEMVSQFVKQFVDDDLERSQDLRGQRIEAFVHSDGLFVTIRRHGER